MRFAAAPEYQVFPTGGRGLKPYEAAVKASAPTLELIRSVDPELVVADILTVAAALAAELDGRTWVTLVPHVLPTGERGFPAYAVGAVHPRTAAGRGMWGLLRPLMMKGEEQGRRELNETRRRVGLPPLDHVQGGISRRLALVATFPQLEYPRVHPQPGARITGPLLWEQPYRDVELPPGDDPLVLVAPSTSQDREGRLLRAALEGLAGEPVRLLASTNRRSGGDGTTGAGTGPNAGAGLGHGAAGAGAGPGAGAGAGHRDAPPLPVPANAQLVDWLSYARTMPHCAAVVCHAGHGTIARALASGVPVVACPHAGDMAENAARVRWAGVGVSLPRRFTTPGGVRLAVRRLLSDPAYARRAQEIREWSERNDGAAAAADALERLTRSSSSPRRKAPRGGFEPPRTD